MVDMLNELVILHSVIAVSVSPLTFHSRLIISKIQSSVLAQKEKKAEVKRIPNLLFQSG